MLTAKNWKQRNQEKIDHDIIDNSVFEQILEQENSGNCAELENIDNIIPNNIQTIDTITSTTIKLPLPTNDTYNDDHNGDNQGDIEIDNIPNLDSFSNKEVLLPQNVMTIHH